MAQSKRPPRAPVKPSDVWQARMPLLRFAMQVFLTVVLLFSALHAIVFNGTNQTWAIGVIGALSGYWFHSQARTQPRRGG